MTIIGKDLFSSSSGSNVSVSGTSAAAGTLANVTGTGVSGLNLVVDGSGVDSSSGLTVGLTYNYTPAVTTPLTAATPEPSCLVLLGTGVVGIMGVVRQRLFS